MLPSRSTLRRASRLVFASMLALGLFHLTRSAQAASCGDFERGAGSRAPACPLAPSPATPAAARAERPQARVGPLETRDVASDVPGVTSVIHAAGIVPDELRNRRTIVEGDLAESDCHGALCGPQSATLRAGMLYLEHKGTFSPMIGGLGAVFGGIAMNLKPGPRPEPAPGPSLDGWAQMPKGLKPAGPPFAVTPLISINNREGGLRMITSW